MEPDQAAETSAVEPQRRESPHPSPRSLRGLDWFVFFVADVQTGFGPFISVYLTTQKWTQIDIGLVLSIGGIVALIGQMPGGAIVDAARSERLVAGVALAAITASALAYALLAGLSRRAWRRRCCMRRRAACSGPAIAAISLGLVGYAAIGERLGPQRALCLDRQRPRGRRDGRLGYFFSAQAVFFVTAALLIPTLLALQPYPSARDRSRARARRRCRERRPKRIAAGLPQPAAQAAAVHLRRLRRCCSTWPMPRCCR